MSSLLVPPALWQSLTQAALPRIEFGNHLDEAARHCDEAGNGHLAVQLRRLATNVRTRLVHPNQCSSHAAFRELQRLIGGQPEVPPVVAASEKPVAVPTNPTSPKIEIDWHQYSSEEYPALPPDGKVQTIAQHLTFWTYFVAMQGMQDEADSSKEGLANYFGIPTGAIDRIQSGEFISETFGHFPALEAGALMLGASRLSTGYGALMGHLLKQQALSVYGWKTESDERKYWQNFLCGLQDNFIDRVIQDASESIKSHGFDKAEVTLMKDKAYAMLREVIAGRMSLENTQWHPRGQLRRDVLMAWMKRLHPKDKAIDEQALNQRLDQLGENMLISMSWHHPLPDNANPTLQLQHRVRRWFCIEHLGAMPPLRDGSLGMLIGKLMRCSSDKIDTLQPQSLQRVRAELGFLE